ncbi:MAG: hypothetical protein VXX50_00715, partial [Candidatus Thermoplasmatota archaeon]|nr:hypothetical protein [Candidatus Thermoplasmatota archaeon]
MTMDVEPPEQGKIRYFDRVEPALNVGSYTLKVSQKLPTELNLHPSEANYDKEVEFNIRGPRWSIEPSNVHLRSPPKNEQGVVCDSSFPRIVLQRKTTPWERNLADSTAEDETPWMALLLIRDDEITDYCSLELSQQSSSGGGVTISSLLNGADAEDEDPTRYVDALKINAQFFKRIAPTLEELPLLVHALQVNPLDKELCGNDEDAWFSVVVSNRIPAKENCKYHACLISLEFADLSDLPDNPEFIPSIDPPSTTGSSPEISDDHIYDKEIFVRQKELEAITEGGLPTLPPEVDPDSPFGPAGRPPSTEFSNTETKLNKMDAMNIEQLDKEISAEHIDQASINSLDKKMGATRKRNLYSAFDILLANPLTGWFRKDKSVQDTKFLDEKPFIKSGHSVNISVEKPHHGIEYELQDSGYVHGVTDPTQLYMNPPVTSGPKLTFPLLHHWTFKTGDGGDFEARMRGLKVRSHEEITEEERESGVPEPVGTLGSLAFMSKSSGTYAPALLGNDMVPDVAINSYLTMDIVGDDGITRTGYYRGPCISVPTKHERKERPYYNSDEARGLDVETGRDEISHSAAFELGRLLGMSDPGFIRAINRWRRLRYIDIQDEEEYVLIKDLFDLKHHLPLNVKDILTKQMLAEKVIQDQLAILERDLGVFDPPPLGDGGFGPAGDPPPIDILPIDDLIKEYESLEENFE